jgi:hypothetical protein
MTVYVPISWLLYLQILYALLFPWMWYIVKLREDIGPIDCAWQLKATLTLALSSFFNHLCADPDTLNCIGSFPTNSLIILDIFCALSLLSAVVSLQLPERERLILYPLFDFISFILCLVFPSGVPAQITIFALNLLVFLYFRSVVLVLHPANHWSALVGILLFGLGLIFEDFLGNYPINTGNQDDINSYSLYHGLWTILSALAGALLIYDSRHNPLYYA